MTLPSNGVQWKTAHGISVNPLAIFQGVITNVLYRDYLGGLTNLCDPVMGTVHDDETGKDFMTPFAADGLYRDDLHDPDFPGGQWWDPGLINDEGWEFSPDFDVQAIRSGQSIRAVRWNETAQDDELSVTFQEVNDITERIRHNKRLVNVRDIGAIGYVSAAPMEPTRVERQIIALLEDGDKRLAVVFPRVGRKKTGKTQASRKNPFELPTTWGALPCPFADTPFYIVPEGAGWRGLGGAPVFSAVPVATAGAAGAATVVFVIPTLQNDPPPDDFTYAYEKKVGAGAWESAGAPATTSATSTQVTAGFTGLTAGSTQFRVIATAQSGQSTTSDASAAVTIT